MRDPPLNPVLATSCVLMSASGCGSSPRSSEPGSGKLLLICPCQALCFSCGQVASWRGMRALHSPSWDLYFQGLSGCHQATVCPGHCPLPAHFVMEKRQNKLRHISVLDLHVGDTEGTGVPRRCVPPRAALELGPQGPVHGSGCSDPTHRLWSALT